MTRLSILVLLVVVACAWADQPAPSTPSSSYVQLDANSFQAEIDSKDIVIVCFYHSRADVEDDLDPEFVVAAERMQGKEATFATVDCAYEKTLQKKYEIEDFPTIRVFRDGKMFHYKRTMEANAIVGFVQRLISPPLRTLSTVSEAIEMTESDKAVLIGFFSPENTKEYEVFLNVASTFQASDDQNAHFAEVVNPKVIKDFEIVYTPMVFLFRPNEEATGYTGMFNEKELADWITVSTTPTLRELTPESFLSIFEDNTPTLLAFVDKSLPATGSLLTVLTETSVQYLHKINFVFAERTHFVGLAEKMGVAPSDNTITILDFHRREHYTLETRDNTTTTSEVKEFCESYLKGTLLRSEDSLIATRQHDDTVPETIVIANPSPDLMMDFYVPWCDFYINIGVPHSGIPRVSLISQPPTLQS